LQEVDAALPTGRTKPLMLQIRIHLMRKQSVLPHIKATAYIPARAVFIYDR
jgi:hypothetical protein